MSNDIPSELQHWVAAQLHALGWQVESTVALSPLSGDAGFRRYFRVSGASMPLLAVISPPATEPNQLFIELAQVLRAGHVCTPTIYCADLDQGWLLIEDFGDQLLWHSLQQQPEFADGLYAQALIDLLALQQERPYQLNLPSYSPQMLATEMNFFSEWFVGRLLGLDGAAVAVALSRVFDELIANALAQPQVLVHRDYHSRNLIERAGQDLGVIDFQGAVWGPITYDLVSLLKDCYLQWPREKVLGWACSYVQLAADAGLLPPVGRSTLLRWFDLMGLQRHIKVLGIFARLALRDGKHQYLEDLPRVIHYVLDAAGRYPETAPLVQLFERQLMPKIEGQPWFEPVVEIAV